MNKEAYRLAGELARLTGETMTGVSRDVFRNCTLSDNVAPVFFARDRPRWNTVIICMTITDYRSDHFRVRLDDLRHQVRSTYPTDR